MTKVQKIWLSVFLAMFLVPEILWSPVVNSVYEWNQNSNHVTPLRDSFLTKSDNIQILSNVLLFQFFALALITIFLFLIRNKINNKVLFKVLIIISFIMTCLVFYYYSLSSIRITF